MEYGIVIRYASTYVIGMISIRFQFIYDTRKRFCIHCDL